MKKIRHVALFLKNALLDALFPEACLGCHKNGEILCESCMLTIHHAERETTDDIVALYDYRHPLIRSAIWHLKYYGKRHLGSILGKVLHEAYLEEISELRTFDQERAIIVIPVPVSRARKKKRTYNQAEIIARHFCDENSTGMLTLQADIVVKTRDTVSQARISSRRARLTNLKGAFDIKDTRKIEGRTVIVIDDVTTTGATLNEILLLLKKSGARQVIGIAVAH